MAKHRHSGTVSSKFCRKLHVAPAAHGGGEGASHALGQRAGYGEAEARAAAALGPCGVAAVEAVEEALRLRHGRGAPVLHPQEDVRALSREAEGYGAARRTSFSLYRFTARDAVTMVLCAFAVGVTAACVVSGGIYARYFPSVIISGFGGIPALGMAAFALLCFLPQLFDAKEALVWRRLRSAI